MKTIVLRGLGYSPGHTIPASAGPGFRLSFLRFAIAAGLLAGVSTSMALPTVTTITGGPSFGYLDGNTRDVALFHTPIGLALDGSGNFLFVADRDNNAIRELNLSANTTFTFAAGLNKPVGVALDRAGNVYVLNRGSGANGTVVKLDAFGHSLGTLVSGLVNAQGIALDSGGNVYVTAGNSVIRITTGGEATTFTTVSASGSVLSGITVLSDGGLAVCDSGRHGIWRISPADGSYTALTGFHGAGDVFGSSAFARFNQPYGISAAGGNVLVVADYSNNRVKVVDPLGTVTNLYGVASSFWVTGSGTYPGWWDGPVARGDANYNAVGYVEARLPAGVLVAGDGSIYSTEDYYHLIRHVTGTDLSAPSGGGGGGGGTNFVLAPTISPSCGYFPMGQVITVVSPNPDVFYTIDGSEPTTNSFPVTINGNLGFIYWYGATNDLSLLRVKAFVGTTASTTTRGESCTANTIGVPPDVSGSIYAGIGSTIVVPVVVNLRSNVQVKSYQFRVEITANGAAPPITGDFQTQSVSSNDFVTLTTAAQNNTTLSVPGLPYNVGPTRGLVVSTTGNGNFGFQKFAVVALLRVAIPPTAQEGQNYSIAVSFPSATSDGGSSSVSLSPMDAATIEVRNIPYLVGDSASPFGTWYNAGTFGDGNLNNADVNSAFYASTGLKVPYSYTDVFNAMDASPSDEPGGFVGGDGQIRVNDWNLILLRSLQVLLPGNTNYWETNLWWRQWSVGGNLVNFFTTPTSAAGGQEETPFGAHPFSLGTWYRQVLLGGISANYVVPNSTAYIPVYVKLGDGSSLATLQFRAVVTPKNGAPAVTSAPDFLPAPGIPAPTMAQSFQADAKAFGWSIGSVNFQSRSSNFLGWITFHVPWTAATGQGYTLSFANADGSPDLYTTYNFETRSANAAINGVAVPASICSDEWKLYYFGSLTDPQAADLANPDGDGHANWSEFIAGTDPTDDSSYLSFSSAQRQSVSGQPQMVLRWSSVKGKAYEVQSSSALIGAGWTTLGTVSGNGAATSYTNNNTTAAAKYYRLRVLP